MSGWTHFCILLFVSKNACVLRKLIYFGYKLWFNVCQPCTCNGMGKMNGCFIYFLCLFSINWMSLQFLAIKTWLRLFIVCWQFCSNMWLCWGAMWYPSKFLHELMTVDSIKWVRSDSIVVGCFQKTEDGREENYFIQVITSKDGQIIDVRESSFKCVTSSNLLLVLISVFFT